MTVNEKGLKALFAKKAKSIVPFLSEKDAIEVQNAIVSEIEKGLIESGRAEIRGFGTFFVRRYSAGKKRVSVLFRTSQSVLKEVNDASIK